MANIFLERLDRIEKLQLGQKEVLNVKELSVFTGWSVSFIYKLSMSRKIPFYKPRPDAKMLFFKRTEIESFLTAYKVKTQEEMEKEASTYVNINKRK
jgi:prophage regulatory protein